jgi:predicted outer membrane repeat protein
MIIERCTVKNYNFGVYAVSGDITIIDSKILNCTCGVASSENMRMNNCTIKDSLGLGVYCAGGAADLRDCLFENNMSFLGGGGLYIDNGDVTISGCMFRGNMVFYTEEGVSCSGGAIYCTNSTVSIVESTFNSNKARENGGAVYSENSNVDIDGCNFSLNHVYDMSETIYITGGELSVRNSKFYCNAGGDITDDYTDGGGNTFDQECSMEIVFGDTIQGDVDGDGDVDMADLAALAEDWLVGT